MNKSFYVMTGIFVFAAVVAGCLWPVQEQNTLQSRVAGAEAWVNNAVIAAQQMQVPANGRVEVAYQNGQINKEEGPANLRMPNLASADGFLCHVSANGKHREARCFSYDYWITLQRIAGDPHTYCIELDGAYMDRDQSDAYVPAQSCQALGFSNGQNGRYYK